jgi:hypothetical protein
MMLLDIDFEPIVSFMLYVFGKNNIRRKDYLLSSGLLHCLQNHGIPKCTAILRDAKPNVQ